MKTLKSVVLILVSVALFSAHANAAQSVDPLLASAAQELKEKLAPFTVNLPDDTVFFNWTNGVAKPEDLPNYVHYVPLDFGDPKYHTDDWAGPGLYLALDPVTSFPYGHVLVELTMRKGTALVYMNAPGSMPLQLTKGSKIREWLKKAGNQAGVIAGEAVGVRGGGDLVRVAGISGFIYNWNSAAHLDGCDQDTTAAINLIDPTAVVKSKMIVGETLFNTTRAEFAQQGDEDFVFLKILDYESDPNRTEGDEHWHDPVPADQFEAYNRWKMAHVMHCQKPYLAKRFPGSRD